MERLELVPCWVPQSRAFRPWDRLLDRTELDEMIAEGKPIETVCHFCNRKYEFTVADLRRCCRPTPLAKS